jgi:hypothetical protein
VQSQKLENQQTEAINETIAQMEKATPTLQNYNWLESVGPPPNHEECHPGKSTFCLSLNPTW